MGDDGNHLAGLVEGPVPVQHDLVKILEAVILVYDLVEDHAGRRAVRMDVDVREDEKVLMADGTALEHQGVPVRRGIVDNRKLRNLEKSAF